MKNMSLHPLLLSTVIFSALILGILTGRLSSLSDNLLAASQTEPAIENTLTESICSNDGRININTATKDDLMLLPFIGPELAERIILYREANGPFSATKDLVNVKGIGEQTYAKIEQFITTGGYYENSCS